MLRAIYKTGSSLILPKPRDIDYLYLYDTIEEKRQAFTNNVFDSEIDRHFKTVEWQGRPFLGSWTYSLCELIEGEEVPVMKNYSIFDHKSELMDICRQEFDLLSLNNKKWYHILIYYYAFKNDKLEFTDEQLDAIQSAHDNGITDEIKSELAVWLKGE